MRESSIVVPNAYFNMLYDWAYAATEKDEPAAKLISIFRYHHDYPYANRVLVNLIERAIVYRKKGFRETGPWLPYSIDYMGELLLNAHGQNQIVNGRIKLLELGFISDNVPADIPAFYSRSYSWYKFEVETVQNWIDKHWLPMQRQSSAFLPAKPDIQEIIEKVKGQSIKIQREGAEPETAKMPELLSRQITTLGKFYIHIHGKNSSYILDAERKNRIRAMLKKLIEQVGELRAFGMCAQAIIGNVKSDFHQGKHPENTLGQISERTGNKGKIYDDIGEHIFKTAKKFDNMIDHAENHGVTEEIALAELQNFIAGTPSQFTKLVKKEPVKARKAQTVAFDAETVRPYRAFAREIVAFFKHVPNPEILEVVGDNEGLVRLGKGLIKPEILFECLMDSAKIFDNGIISEKIENQMKDFATSFCAMREFN